VAKSWEEEGSLEEKDQFSSARGVVAEVLDPLKGPNGGGVLETLNFHSVGVAIIRREEEEEEKKKKKKKGKKKKRKRKKKGKGKGKGKENLFSLLTSCVHSLEGWHRMPS
jgi:hypothetical protein